MHFICIVSKTNLLLFLRINFNIDHIYWTKSPEQIVSKINPLPLIKRDFFFFFFFFFLLRKYLTSNARLTLFYSEPKYWTESCFFFFFFLHVPLISRITHVVWLDPEMINFSGSTWTFTTWICRTQSTARAEKYITYQQGYQPYPLNPW